MRGDFNQCRPTLPRCDCRTHGRTIELYRIIEWCLFTDYYAAAHEAFSERDMLQVLQHMGFASAKVTGNEHAHGLLSGFRCFLSGLKLGTKLFFNRQLLTAQRLHCITTGHTGTECFNGTATASLIAHLTASCTS